MIPTFILQVSHRVKIQGVEAIQSTVKLLLITVMLLTVTGCPLWGWDWDEPEDSDESQPVYMSYQELRGAVSYEAPRELEEVGRIYLYNDYFFLNQRNAGIHVFDNSDPSAPVNMGFVNIPGNTELAIRSNQLYADSYVDLVTLDISNPVSYTHLTLPTILLV